MSPDHRPALVGKRSLLLAMAITLSFGSVFAERQPDGVNLTVSEGPGAEEITLDWTGGQPTFGVFFSEDPSTIDDPSNKTGETDQRTWTAQMPEGALEFLLITSPCVVNPPEICDHLDNDCNGEIDEGFVDENGEYTLDANCGTCGNDCTLLMFEGRSGVCTDVCGEPVCSIDCVGNCFDCNCNPTDGCECCDPTPSDPCC